MGRQARKKAQDLLNIASEGVVRCGHLGIYRKIEQDLRVARDELAGREELLRFDEIRRALDAKIEELTKALQDPSVADHVAIGEGVYKLLRGCQPLYLALSQGLSVKEACDALDAAGATLDGFADEDAAYHEYRRLNGGTVRIGGRRVKLNATKFAAWQKKNKESKRKFEQDPYKHTAQTTEQHGKAVSNLQKKQKNESRATRRRTKKICTEDEPTPPNLRMRVTAGNKVKYCVKDHLYKYAPAGYSNGFTTKKKALALAALCEANRPAGMGREAKQAARAEEGRAPGVTPFRGRFKAFLNVAKNTYVTLAAPGGGFLFDTAAAAGKAIKKWEKAGSPTKPSDPLYDTLVDSVQRRK